MPPEYEVPHAMEIDEIKQLVEDNLPADWLR